MAEGYVRSTAKMTIPLPYEGRLGWVLPRKGNMENKISTHLIPPSQGGFEVYLSLRGAKRRSNPIYNENNDDTDFASLPLVRLPTTVI